MCSVTGNYVWHAAGCAHQTALLRLTASTMCVAAGGTEALQVNRRLCSPQGHPYHALHSGRQHAGQSVGPPLCASLSSPPYSEAAACLCCCEDVQPSCVLSCACKVQLQPPATHSRGCCEPLLCWACRVKSQSSAAPSSGCCEHWLHWACQCGSKQPLHLRVFTACQGCGGLHHQHPLCSLTLHISPCIPSVCTRCPPPAPPAPGIHPAREL